MIESLRIAISNLLLPTNLGAANVCSLTFIIMACGAGVVCFFLNIILRMVITPLACTITKKTPTKIDDFFINKRFLHAVSRTIPTLIYASLLPQFIPTDTKPPLIFTITDHVVEAFVTLTFIWVITSLLNNVRQYANQTESLKNYHLEGIIQFIKLLVYFIGCIVIVACLFNKNPLTLFAGLGAAATIIMLIFKDSILGLVASIQISINKMIKKEDWIIIENKGVNGIVEEINLTTVKVRNFDNSVSMIPPYSLVSESFQNWGCMHETGKRRVMRTIPIDAHSICFVNNDEHTTNLTQYRAFAEDFLKCHPLVSKDKWIMARQLEPTAHGLPLQVWFYLNITEFVNYEQQAANIMEYLIASLPKYNLKIYQYSSEPF